MIRSVFRLVSLLVSGRFVESDAAPTVHAKISETKLLCSTSKFCVSILMF